MNQKRLGVTDKTPVSDREEIELRVIDIELSKLSSRLFERLAQKGYGTLASRHEILGMITEEHQELVEAVRAGGFGEVYSELQDIAVGCVFAMACIASEKVDW